MSSTLRTALFSSALSLTVGCGFFSLDETDAESPKPSAAGKGGTSAAAGAGGSITASGGSSGMVGAGGDLAATGGSAGSGTGGTSAAGSGGSAGAETTGGAGGTAGGASPMGGAGGDASAAGGMSAGGAPAGGMGAAAGAGPISSCAAADASAKSFAGHCYLLVTATANFGAAKSACAAKSGGHLVTISNGDPAAKETFDAENSFVFELADGKDTWIGLADGQSDHDTPNSTPYTWLTGEPNPLEEWGKTYGWVDGEPNNYQKACMDNSACFEHCGMMVSDQGGKWNDDLCETAKQYMCEWDSGGDP